MMKKYRPTMHDQQDDHQPWATMEPYYLGGFYAVEEVDKRIAELEREIEKQKQREMKAKCLHCGHTLFITEPNTTL